MAVITHVSHSFHKYDNDNEWIRLFIKIFWAKSVLETKQHGCRLIAMAATICAIIHAFIDIFCSQYRIIIIFTQSYRTNMNFQIKFN